MGILNNVTTTDGYTAGNSLSGLTPPRSQATVMVSNASVFVQFAVTEEGPVRHPEGYDFEFTERFLVPANWQFGRDDFNGQRVVGVRVRSAVVGVPAQVTIHA